MHNLWFDIQWDNWHINSQNVGSSMIYLFMNLWWPLNLQMDVKSLSCSERLLYQVHTKKKVLHTSINLMHLTKCFTRCRFVVKSSQMTWTILFKIFKATLFIIDIVSKLIFDVLYCELQNTYHKLLWNFIFEGIDFESISPHTETYGNHFLLK